MKKKQQARRTVEVGAVTIVGLRQSGKKHLVLLHIDGIPVELPFGTAMLPVMQDLYGRRVKLLLVDEDFDPAGGAWRESSGQFFRPTEETDLSPSLSNRTEPKPPKPRKKMTASPEAQLRADEALLARVRDVVGGKAADVGLKCGMGVTTFYNVRTALDQGRMMTDRVRGKFEKLVAGARAK